MMEKEVSQPAGEEVRTEAGAETLWGRGDRESARASRVPAAALPVHGTGQRGPPGSLLHSPGGSSSESCALLRIFLPALPQRL